MRRTTTSIAAATIGLAAMAGGASAAVGGPITHRTTVDFGFTGAPQDYRVPVGVETIDVVACGAEGGTGSGELPLQAEFGAAGFGAEVDAQIATTPSAVIQVRVGGMGGETGGYNGGGTSVFVAGLFETGQGGGGASDVRVGGAGLDDRVVVAGGGGGGGGGLLGLAPLPPSELLGGNGGLVGANAIDAVGGRGAAVDAGGEAGEGDFQAGFDGGFGVGGDAPNGAGGGGGGLYGGGGGSVDFGYGGGGGGGSSLGDRVVAGQCGGDGHVTVSFDQPLAVSPYGAGVTEGDSGSRVVQVPVLLSAAVAEPVTVQWETIDGLSSPGLASDGSDYVAASGEATFAPGDTRAFIPIEVLGDTSDEEPLLWGEWGLVQLSGVSPNAVLDPGPMLGATVFVIFDDD